eukprot:1155857-Pelagomonas_calceolata.AAC.5
MDACASKLSVVNLGCRLQPAILVGVPRVWERVRAGVQKKLAERTPIARLVPGMLECPCTELTPCPFSGMNDCTMRSLCMHLICMHPMPGCILFGIEELILP